MDQLQPFGQVTDLQDGIFVRTLLDIGVIFGWYFLDVFTRGNSFLLDFFVGCLANRSQITEITLHEPLRKGRQHYLGSLVQFDKIERYLIPMHHNDLKSRQRILHPEELHIGIGIVKQTNDRLLVLFPHQNVIDLSLSLMSVADLLARLQLHRYKHALRLASPPIDQLPREKQVDLALQPEETAPEHALTGHQLVNPQEDPAMPVDLQFLPLLDMPLKEPHNIIQTPLASRYKPLKTTLHQVHIVQHRIVQFPLDFSPLAVVLVDCRLLLRQPLEQTMTCTTVDDRQIDLLLALDVVAEGYAALAVDPGAYIGGVQQIMWVEDDVGVLQKIHGTARTQGTLDCYEELLVWEGQQTVRQGNVVSFFGLEIHVFVEIAREVQIGVDSVDRLEPHLPHQHNQHTSRKLKQLAHPLVLQPIETPLLVAADMRIGNLATDHVRIILIKFIALHSSFPHLLILKLITFPEYLLIDAVHNGVVAVLDGLLAVVLAGQTLQQLVGLVLGLRFPPLAVGEAVGIAAALRGRTFALHLLQIIKERRDRTSLACREKWIVFCMRYDKIW